MLGRHRHPNPEKHELSSQMQGLELATEYLHEIVTSSKLLQQESVHRDAFCAMSLRLHLGNEFPGLLITHSSWRPLANRL